MLPLAKKVIESPVQISFPMAVEVTVNVGTGVTAMVILAESVLQAAVSAVNPLNTRTPT